MGGAVADDPLPPDEPPPAVELCFGRPAGEHGTTRSALAVSAAVRESCTTTIVRPLSEQLIAELECLRPGQMARIDRVRGVATSAAVFPWLQTPAKDALARATAGGGTLPIASALRTLPQQYLLYHWYLAGRCGIALAAPPGRSNHQSGLAIDTGEHAAWRSRLEAAGFRWLGASDPPHFDFVGAGTVDLRAPSVRAFQRLWNANHPSDRIAEDGVYGPETEARLARSPAEGFPIGSTCEMPPPDPGPPPPEPAPMRIALRWTLEADATYTLTAAAPEGVERVLWSIDGHLVGEGRRAWANDFAASAGACADRELHRVDLRANDMEGNPVGDATAWLEARPERALFVQPRADGSFAVGLERPDEAVTAIEVDLDGDALVDASSGERRSARRIVRFTPAALGEHELEVRAYGDAGAILETWAALVELR